MVWDCGDRLSGAVRGSGEVGASCRRLGPFGDVGVQAEAWIDAEMPRPGGGKNGRPEASAAFGGTTARARLRPRSIGVTNCRYPVWSDHDPSRVAVEHGTCDFAQRAVRVPA